MTKVVFVGDEPSRMNLNATIPFVGAKCFPTLVDWIKRLAPDYYVVMNSNTKDDLIDIESYYKAGFKVIALGNKASKRLEKIKVGHYKMPHPSGLNRILNDEARVALELYYASSYILGLHKDY